MWFEISLNQGLITGLEVAKNALIAAKGLSTKAVNAAKSSVSYAQRQLDSIPAVVMDPTNIKLEGEKIIANGVIRVNQSVLAGATAGLQFLPIEIHPEVATLIFQKEVASAVLLVATELVKATQSAIASFPIEDDPRGKYITHLYFFDTTIFLTIFH